jgi:hypothetical protein
MSARIILALTGGWRGDDDAAGSEFQPFCAAAIQLVELAIERADINRPSLAHDWRGDNVRPGGEFPFFAAMVFQGVELRVIRADIDRSIRANGGRGHHETMGSKLPAKTPFGSHRVNDPYERRHKPVLLLAILDLLDCGLLTKNEVPLSPDLVRVFKQYFAAVRRHNDQPAIENPFYFLAGDGFWELVPKGLIAQRKCFIPLPTREA